MSDAHELVGLQTAENLAAVEAVAPTRAVSVKPLLRGVPDVLATLFAVPATAVLIASATEPTAQLAAIIYGASLSLLFAVSGTYHTPWWPPKVRKIWRAIDHATIYLLIAGSYTPFCLVALEPDVGRTVLIIQWSIAALGITKSILWTKSPRWLNTLIYIGMGWVIAPLTPALWAAVGPLPLALIGLGGIIYTTGAVIYARRWPNPWPAVFGYHELFHVFVVAASAAHFVAMWMLLT